MMIFGSTSRSTKTALLLSLLSSSSLFETNCYAFFLLSSSSRSSSTASKAFRPRTNARISMASSSDNTVQFSKYHGLGNDFILIDNRSLDSPSLTPEQSSALCDRNFGVGGDGVIFALKPPSDGNYDYAMRIYNSDGSEPEMCGNGIRCMAQFLNDIESEADSDKSSYQIHTLAGTIVPVMNPSENTITVDMGEPIFKASDVPTTLESNYAEDGGVVEQSYTLNDKTWKISAVSMGNPHAVIFVNDLEKDIDFEVDGPALESATSIFPAKTNVEFVQVLAPDHLKMKVWERGAGPTLACGTGACALAIAAMRANKIPRTLENGSPNSVRVTLPGGDLFIEWHEDDNKVYMTGPATFAFSGTAEVI